jgi:hypothetical protein
VDGEFYYRCCVVGLENRLNQARSLRPSDQEAIHAAIESIADDFGLPWHVAVQAVQAGRKLRLRNPSVNFVGYDDPFDSDLLHVATGMSIDIYSSAARGREIAEHFQRAFDGVEWRQSDSYEADENVIDDRITSTLVGGDDASIMARTALDAGWEWADLIPVSQDEGVYVRRPMVGPPHINVRVSLPPPSPEVIAAHVDVVMNQWRGRITQGVNQDPETAIRTWTIALLMTDGLNFGQALYRWRRFGGSSDISNRRFDEDKKRLLSRVPEARPVLMRRKCHPFGGA